MTFVRYTLDEKACMVIRSCLWSIGYSLVYRLGLGLGAGNEFYSFPFSALKSDERLRLVLLA